MESERPGEVTYLARTNFHNSDRLFGIKQADRLSHIYVIGKTGTGKSTLLETLMRQDILAGRGFALIDPHGDLASRIAAEIPLNEQGRVVHLDASDPNQPFGYNPLRRVRDDKIPLAVSGLLETLRKLWSDAWGMRMEHVFRNCLFALLERPGSTLPDILALFSDDAYRKAVISEIRNETVQRFWKQEFDHYPARMRAEAVAPIQNKIGALLSDPMLYRILVTPETDLRFRPLMDEGRVVLVNAAKGRLGEDSALLLGSLALSTMGLAAFSRADLPARDRRPFFIYVDEFQNFTSLMIANLLSELRKYGVGLVMAHQNLQQLEPEIRSAVIGNAGTLVSFRLGAEDATSIAAELAPTFSAEDLLRLPNRHIYLKLLIDGEPSNPFSASTILASEAVQRPVQHAPVAPGQYDPSVWM